MKTSSFLQVKDLCSRAIDACTVTGFDIPADHRLACADTHVIACLNGFAIGKGSQTLTLVRWKRPIASCGNIGDFFALGNSREENIVFRNRL